MKNNVSDILQAGENETAEFKTTFSDEVIETLVAFANAQGGCVYIGITDDRKVKGVDIGKETLQKWQNSIKNKTQPSIIPVIDVITDNGLHVVCIKVNEFPVKPLSCKGRYYKRTGNANHQLSTMEITDMNLQSLQLSWDAYPCLNASLEDIDMEKVRKFTAKVNTTGRFHLSGTPEEDLRKLKLMNNGQTSNAAVLLFSKEEIIYNIHLGRLKTPSLIIDDRILRLPLFDAVEETMKYIISQIKFAYEITGKTTQRTEIPEYPLEALRELVLNAVIHRDYLSPADIQIKIFDNYITFFNPGKLHPAMTVEDLKTNSYPAYARNKLIAEAFYLTGDIEKYGSGFLRIRKALKGYPSMTIDCREISGGLMVTIAYKEQKTSTIKPKYNRLNEGANEGANEGVNRLLKLIEENPGNRKPYFVSSMNVPEKTMERWLKYLRESQKIEFRGAAKTGGYYSK